ncbi:MAG: T9SS type A sorting domain-containing protein, partial [Candidatus Kapaibacterium sp.]
RKFYDTLVFDSHDFIEARDMEFSYNESIVGVTHGLNLKLYSLSSKNKIHEYFESSWQNLSFSRNNDYLVTNVGSYLLLFPSYTGLSSVETTTTITGGVYPNPASDFIKIDMNASAINSIIEIFDAYGKQVMSAIYTGEYIDISKLTAGVYFVKTQSQSYKFIKL